MRGRIRGVEIWIVVLVTATAWVVAGAFGPPSGHAARPDTGTSALASERSSGLLLPSDLERSLPSARSLISAAFSPSYAGELSSPNAQTGGCFGYAVAVSGTTVVVGAFDETAAGDGGAGHAYTFNAKTGALLATLTSPNAQVGGVFGYSVAVSGTTVVVGAPLETAAGDSDAGHAYTFNAKTGALIATLTSPNAQVGGLFGIAVAVSGPTAVVGAVGETAAGESGAGHAYTFKAKTGALIATLTSPNAQFYGSFGNAVAVSGTTVVVGAESETVGGDAWAGHTYTFSAKTGALIATLTSPTPQTGGFFGFAVGAGGTTVLVGAPDETAGGDLDAGHAYAFNAKTGALIATLASPNEQTGAGFGVSVAVGGTTLLVAAENETVSGVGGAGQAYTFSAKTDLLTATLTSPNAQAGGYFGIDAAVSGATIVVGADGELAFGLSAAGHAYLM